MVKLRLPLIVVAGLFLVGLALTSAFKDRHYVLISIVLLTAAMLPLFLRLERRAPGAREIVLLAVLAALAAVSRIPFAALPSVKPVTAIVVLSAYVFGAEAGFIIGAAAALVSNLYFGQGPWTPWQMFAWGMAGMTAGMLRHTWWIKTRTGLAVFGFVWGFLFGWIMNLWGLLSMPDALSWPFVASYMAASFYFDLAHALSNVFFLLLLSRTWITVMERFRKKYGLLQLDKPPL